MSLDTNRRTRIKWPFAKAMIDFMENRPAYIPLLSAPRTYKRDPVARNRLRETDCENSLLLYSAKDGPR